MSLSQVHIASLYLGAPGAYGNVLALTYKAVWSQTMPAPGVTDKAAPEGSTDFGQPSFEISAAAADVFVAVSPTPDATSSPRIVVRAGETRNVFCRPGDKLAWIEAT